MKSAVVMMLVAVVAPLVGVSALSGKLPLGEEFPVAMTTEPMFSFKYDGRTVRGGGTVQVDARLRVTVERANYPAFDATEWVLWFENPSAEKSGVLSEIQDGDFLVALPPEQPKFIGDVSVPGDRAVITMQGCGDGDLYSVDDFRSAQEFCHQRRYFHPRVPKTFEVQNTSGRSSDGQAPFFEVNGRDCGAVIAYGWTGDWKATFQNRNDGVRVTTGLRNARFYLKPGEKLRTGRVLVMNYGVDEDSGNKFRRLVRRHFSHVSPGGARREGIFATELWGGLTSDEMVRRLKVLKAKGFAFEDVWIDAGWYGESKKCEDCYTGDWAMWTGDWRANARVHPDNLESVRGAAKDMGAGLMLWFEPERVAKTAKFAKSHSELLFDAGWSHLLSFGNPDARALVTDLVSDFARRLDFSCYRQDFNMGLSDVFAKIDEKDRRGISEIRHVTGLYAVWDELLARNPGLLIDNCASGGRRLDIETLRRSVFFFRSDYQCAFNANADVVQAHNAGLSRLIPFSGCTTKSSDLYSLRSSYSSSYGVAYWNAVFQDEAKIDWASAKKSHDEYLKIRKYFSRDFYNHGSETHDACAWAIWQYHDPESAEGILMAFRRGGSPCDRAVVALRGLPDGARVSVENFDSGMKNESDGTVTVVLPERRSSTIFAYRIK